MKTKQIKIITGLICGAMLCMLTQLAMAAEVPRMTKEELKAKMGNSDHNIIVFSRNNFLHSNLIMLEKSKDITTII